ncbi:MULTISPECIES: thioredoxin family protein [unclassified Flavobacterium]|uniref:thioredoxin family protein n=1 Tax=unclassified Flavobacterium TaxID=196869 RepID=UPI000966996C|nr:MULTISPECIES: thioredoxin family protein [unclassified Flavobacterium]MBN9284738.1 thioredoxin family protein [Flavobacterium sp.]OJV71241.1 MAG: thiol-disulfide isomerase [Flavobacterium sp. 40-81]
MKITCLLLLLSTFSYAQHWETNFEESKKSAAAENKNIILVFSGSDWCAPCIKLDKAIWSSEAFQTEAKTNWVLVKADFPKKKTAALSETLKSQNASLAEQYNKEGHFPLVVVLDKNGKVLGKTGYKNVNPEEYIKLLHTLEKKI